MAAYNVRLYHSTGFNGVNIPDSPRQLNKCAFTDLDKPLQLVQNRFLDFIDVPMSWGDVEDVDYVRVGGWYYSIPANGIKMQSTGVARLTLISDPLTSAGGFSINETNGNVSAKFDILDGITQRCTTGTDFWGEFTNEDPLIVPQEPLQIETQWLTPTGGNVPTTIEGDPICIESTIDLSSQAFEKEGKTYSDSETGETVTVPQTKPIKTSSADHTTSFNIDGSVVSNGTEIFIRNDNGTASTGASKAGVVVDKGLSVVRQLGIETGSIISQYRLPKEFCGGISISYPFATGNDGADTGQRITLITGVNGSMKSSISPDYARVNNKRVLYGTYNKYGMITCSGNSAEFKPEDLGGEYAPSISYKSDPRPKGRPYYRFTVINGNTEFWRNSLAGSEWENVPLVYQGASNSALNRLNFDNDRRIKSLNKTQFEQQNSLQALQSATNSLVSGIDAFGDVMTGKPVDAITKFVSTAYNTSLQYSQLAMAKNQYEDSYRAQKANELSQLYQTTDVYAPTVNFPYNADILRDVKGNGVLIYKYRMSSNDIARIDTLLTMYGYQTAERLTLKNFGRRVHFDYVACNSVSITGLPKWWCDEIATQLKVGVRVWHELPNSNAYSGNPIR